MDNEKKGIDVFQDGDVVEEKEIFKNYDNQPAPTKFVSNKTAVIAIVAAILILMMVAASFVGGYFLAKSRSVESDMPMLQSAYELVKKYYYKDISWDEFQKVATKQFIQSIDNFSYMLDANTPSGGMSAGFSTSTNVNNHHIVTQIVHNSPVETAEALLYCENPTINKSGKLEYITYSTQTDVQDQHVKIEIGDKVVGISMNDLDPQGHIVNVEGMTSANVQSLLRSSNTITLYIQKSNGEGGFEESGVYKYVIEKQYITTKYAFLYTPDEIGDTTGKTAMIQLTSFEGTAIKDFYECAQAFVDGGYTNLILDLRDNGGGSETILQYIAGCLINGADQSEKEIIYYVRNAGDGKMVGGYSKTVFKGTVQYTDADDETYDIVNLPSKVEGFKLTILCNGNSASSSEALIGALEYYNGTQIIGSTTFGKGIGQITIPFGDYMLYIPNGSYYIPTDENGDGVTEWTTCIHGVGFTPSVENTIDTIIRPMSTDKAIKRALTLLG